MVRFISKHRKLVISDYKKQSFNLLSFFKRETMSLTSGTLAKIALGEELVGHFEDPVFQVNTVRSTYRVLPYMI